MNVYALLNDLDVCVSIGNYELTDNPERLILLPEFDNRYLGATYNRAEQSWVFLTPVQPPSVPTLEEQMAQIQQDQLTIMEAIADLGVTI